MGSVRGTGYAFNYGPTDFLFIDWGFRVNLQSGAIDNGFFSYNEAAITEFWTANFAGGIGSADADGFSFTARGISAYRFTLDPSLDATNNNANLRVFNDTSFFSNSFDLLSASNGDTVEARFEWDNPGGGQGLLTARDSDAYVGRFSKR